MGHDVEEKLRQYYREQELLKQKQKKIEKDKDLISRGLYYEETREATGNSDYWVTTTKKIAYDISDEEYELVKQYDDIKTETVNKTPLYKVINGIGIAILVIGFIVGLIIGEEGIILSFVVWATYFIFGTLFFALAKIIELLEDIKVNTKKD